MTDKNTPTGQDTAHGTPDTPDAGANRKRLSPIKGKMPVLIGLLALVMALIWMLNRCSHKPETAANFFTHPDGDTLVVAIEMSPLSYSYAGDSVSGFDYEMLTDICKAHKVPVVFHPFAPLNYAFEGLDDGRFDMIVASLPATEELRKKYPLSQEVYIDRQVLVQQKKPCGHNKITEQNQLRGDTVWVADNSPYLTRLRNMSQELGDTVFVLSDPQYSSEHLCILTSLGEIPRAVVSESVAKRMAAKYDNISYDVPISFSQFQTWAVSPKYPELLDSIDRWITQFKATTRYNQLMEKYL